MSRDALLPAAGTRLLCDGRAPLLLATLGGPRLRSGDLRSHGPFIFWVSCSSAVTPFEVQIQKSTAEVSGIDAWGCACQEAGLKSGTHMFRVPYHLSPCVVLGPLLPFGCGAFSILAMNTASEKGN